MSKTSRSWSLNISHYRTYFHKKTTQPFKTNTLTFSVEFQNNSHNHSFIWSQMASAVHFCSSWKKTTLDLCKTNEHKSTQFYITYLNVSSNNLTIVFNSIRKNWARWPKTGCSTPLYSAYSWLHVNGITKIVHCIIMHTAFCVSFGGVKGGWREAGTVGRKTNSHTTW